MTFASTGASIPEATHHRVALNGTRLHYVEAGSEGSPILLVHGWPESWWAFRRLIPLLARRHRVFAVDLRGLGDSDIADGAHDNERIAEDLLALIGHLRLGPVHISTQDCSGPAVHRLAARHPQDLLSLTAIETVLPGFGLELLANPLIAWYFGVLVKPGAADAFFRGREQELFGTFIFSAATRIAGAVTAADIAEFARTYGRAGGWGGAQAVYASNLADAETVKALAAAHPLILPTMTVDHQGSDFTFRSISAAHAGGVIAKKIDGVGHYIAMEAADQLAALMLDFVGQVDG